MILAIGIVTAVILMYLLMYYLNKNTPQPDGVDIKIDKATCSACNNAGCAARQE